MSREQRPLPPLTPGKTPQQVNELLRALRNEPCHLLTSIVQIDSIPAMHEIAFHALKFNPLEGSGDVYRDKRWPANEVALTHDALMRLWNAAGGQFVDSHAENQELHFIEWKCAGRVREMGGMWTTEWASRRIDLRPGSSEILGQTTGQIEQQRRDIYQLAESKAQNRVVRKLIGIRQKYPVAEIEWPFIIVRPMMIVNMDDPMQKALYMADSMGGLTALFGNGAFMQFITTKQIAESDGHAQLGTGIPQQSLNAAPQQAPAPLPQRSVLNAAVAAKLSLEEHLEAFGGMSNAGQVEELLRMVKQKDFDLKTLTTPVKDLNDKWRREFFRKLFVMPDIDDDPPPFKL